MVASVISFQGCQNAVRTNKVYELTVTIEITTLVVVVVVVVVGRGLDIHVC